MAAFISVAEPKANVGHSAMELIAGQRPNRTISFRIAKRFRDILDGDFPLNAREMVTGKRQI
jgi:hypothetical protein